MTEYKEFHCPHGDDFEGGEECDRCEQYELCMETSTADVVEREEYNKLKEDYELSVEAHKQSLKLYNKLRSKIDKAIEEMERSSIAADYEGKKEISKTIDKCVEIFKDNMGE